MIECVPNISEGRRLDVVEKIVGAVRAVAAVHVLDATSDPDHNRSVITMAGDAQGLKRAALALATSAVELIDLRNHTGSHPRIGALDVLPFVPLGSSSMAECVDLARDAGQLIARELDVPVFLYERAATRPERGRLENIRRGQFEGLTAKMQQTEWSPDFGPSSPHPTAGAAAVGARRVLIAYNVNLDSDRLEIARQLARTIRESSGGLPAVKALGVPLPHRGIVQVSMNLTDFERTPLELVFDRIVSEAKRLNVAVLETEIVGLIPHAALAHVAPEYLKLARFSDEKILENRLARLGHSEFSTQNSQFPNS